MYPACITTNGELAVDDLDGVSELSPQRLYPAWVLLYRQFLGHLLKS